MAIGDRQQRAFRVGDTSSRALATWIVTLPKTAVLALVALAPVFAWTWFTEIDADAGPEAAAPPHWSADVLESLFNAAFGVVLSGMVIYIAFKHLMREPGSIGTAISIGMRRIVPLGIVGVVTGLLAGLPLLLIALSARDDLTDVAEPADTGRALATGGLALVSAVAQIVINTLFAAAAGAVVVENIGGIAALKRSLALTRGCRGRVFLCFVVTGLVGGILGAILGFVLGLALSDLPLLTTIVIACLGSPLGAILSATIYHDLRAVKEGVDVAELARVFA